MAMKTELSTAIIWSGPRLFENISRAARIEERPGGNTPGYVARAIDIGGLGKRRALGNGDTRNPRFHLNACFQNVLKRLAAPRGDAACSCSVSGGRMIVKKSSGGMPRQF
jgi:hypothetical protein